MEIEPLKIRKKSVDRLSDEERLALARLAEVTSKWNISFSNLGWINEKHKVKVRLPEALDAYTARRVAPPHRRSSLFLSMLWAFGMDEFELWFGDLLALLAKGPDARQQILSGSGDWAAARKALQILGYELVMGRNLFDEETLVALPITGGREHKEEKDKLRSILAARHPSALSALQGAYNSYLAGGSDGKRQACESARNALENLIRDFTAKELGPGIREVSSDSDSRTKLLSSLRDFLSGRGPHARTPTSDEDAYLAIRTAEEVCIWLLRHRGEW